MATTLSEPLGARERDENKRKIQQELVVIEQAKKAAKEMRLKKEQLDALEIQGRRLEDSLKIVETGYPLFIEVQDERAQRIALSFYTKPLPPEVIIRLRELQGKEVFTDFEIIERSGDTFLLGRYGESRALVAKW
ncbi:MAG: hypothetical protein QXO51_01125 [Halobacteria archaeon]